MSGEPYEYGPGSRARVASEAHDSLVAAVDRMRRGHRLDRRTAEIVADIKTAMHAKVQPHGFTVLQSLCEGNRAQEFHRAAAASLPMIRQQFEEAIQDFVTVREGRTPARLTHNIAENAWKRHPAADRRIREMECEALKRWHSPYKGRPEVYDPGVVTAFRDAVARAAGREKFARGNREGGLMVAVLVAAVKWAMTVAWQCAAPPGSAPPKVAREGILRIVRGR